MKMKDSIVLECGNSLKYMKQSLGNLEWFARTRDEWKRKKRHSAGVTQQAGRHLWRNAAWIRSISYMVRLDILGLFSPKCWRLSRELIEV